GIVRALFEPHAQTKPVFTLAEGAATSRFLAMIRGMKAPSFMDLALKTAENAGKSGEVPIGCVVVRNYEVIATAANRTLTDYDPTAHAEIIADHDASDRNFARLSGVLGRF